MIVLPQVSSKYIAVRQIESLLRITPAPRIPLWGVGVIPI